MSGLAAAILIASCSAPPPPVVAVLIDDIGYKPEEDAAVIALPGPYAVAVLPESPHGAAMAELAHAQGKEVLLHLPMEAAGRENGLGSLALREGMAAPAMEDALSRALASVPHAIGVNNHMGSALTRQPQAMQWLMGELEQRGTRFFIDSRTTPATVAAQSATDAGLAGLSRQVFLDHTPTRPAVRAALETLVSTARQQGHALAIGHPFPATLAELSAWSPEASGVEMVSLQVLLTRKVALESASALAGGPECKPEREQAQDSRSPGSPGKPLEVEGDALLGTAHQATSQ